jgi:hypothetical protein
MSYSPSVIVFYPLQQKRVLQSRWLAMDYSGLFSRKHVLASRWLAMDYSGFSGVMSLYVFRHHLFIPKKSPDDGLSAPKHIVN